MVRELINGKTEKEVAAALKLKVHTVHNCIKQLYQRLGIASRAELVSWYWRGNNNS